MSPSAPQLAVVSATQTVAEPAGGDIDWLWNTLTVSGPAETVARFRSVASGTNAAPWHVDLDYEEARLLAPMASAGVEARLLARELRELIARRQERIRTNWAGPGGCPFDLHRLVPVPQAVLAQGEGSSSAQSWLRTHWGTVKPLRHVEVLDRLEDKRLRRSAKIAMRFQSADWTPWQAVRQLRADWRQLVFDVRPDYGGA